MAETPQPVLAPERANKEVEKTTGLEHAPSIGLPAPTFIPRRYKPRNVGEWSGHLTFASELIAALEPSLIVELGTHWGEAYFTFCQTVQERGLSSLCYAVDHWEGDEHAGHYGEEVFEEVSGYNERLYRQFSYLLRRSFDDAAGQFGDNSIGLLHIDGLHTYEAVKHDFENWLPKVQPGGIVLFHDICPRHQDFGVWRLWDELKAQFSDTFEFHHSWGLGVLRKPANARTAPLLEFLFHSSPNVQEEVRRHYVIYASHLERLLGRVERLPAPRPEAPAEIRVQVFPRINGAYTQETSQVRKIKAGEWSTLVFDLRDANIRGPLRIDPGEAPAFVEVGDVAIHSVETDELLWSSHAGISGDFQVTGTARACKEDGSLLFSWGEDPVILLNTPAEVRGPQKVTVSLRVIPASWAVMEVVHSQLQPLLAEAVEQAKQHTSLTAAAQARAEEVTRERDAARNELEQARPTLEQTRQLLAQEQARVAGIVNSLSWRVTAPLRGIMEAVRGPRKA